MFKFLKTKKWTSLLVALLMVVSILSPGLSPAAKAAGESKTFDLIEITDFHGTLQSADATPLPVGAVLAKNIKDVKAANPTRTLIMGGGDLYQGSPISNVLKGVPVQKAWSNIGMEVTTVGNHEFDWKLDTVINTTMKDAKYSMVSANLYNKATGKRVFDPYKIFTKDGVRIAVIGGITAESPTIIMPAYVADYDFKDAATEINAVAKEIKDGKLADVTIALIHAGNSTATTGEVFDIASKLTNVNAIFGGHTHSVLTATSSNGIPIFIGNYNGKGFIDVKMTVKPDGSVSIPTPAAGNYIAVDGTGANGYKAAAPVQDAEVKAIVDAANVELGPTFNEVIGTTATALTRTQVGTPYGESYLGNWAADAVKSKVSADVGVANNGGLRCDIAAGNITVGNIFSFMPFDNEINVVTMTKAQLKVVLEQAFMDGGKGIQISGIKVKYDSAKPSMSRVIEITRENGTAISDTEKLKVAGPDFVLTGGDGFAGFTDPAVKASLETPHILARDAFLENVRANKGITTTMNSRITNAAKTISVLATSDLHGSVYPWDYFGNKAADLGLAKVSTYVNSVRAANSNVMLIDNGDTIQGTPLVTYYNLIDKTKTYPMMAVMGAMKYDTWTLGNHEFNFGLDTLNRVINDAKAAGIHVLAGNVYKADNTNFVEPYYIKDFTVNGKTVKVAVIGLENECVPNWDGPANFTGLHFNNLVDEAKKWVAVVKEKGANVVILAAHSGEKGAADIIPENQVTDIAKNVSGIDAIIAGHAHSLLNDLTLKNPDGKVVPVLEPKNNGTYVSKIDIAIDGNGNYNGIVTTSNVAMDKTIAADTNITDVVAKPYQDATLAYVKTKIGTSTAEYTGAGQLVQPTAIMDLINKVQMKAAGAQLSIAAPLSASARIPSGDITIQDIMSVYIYENFLYGVKMNGKQIKDWLEWSVRYYKQTASASDPIVKDPVLNIADYNLDQLYGAGYDVDLTQPVGSRIKNLTYNGSPIKDTDVFTVAINNYRYNGGGGFMKAAGLSSTDPSIVTYDSAKTLGDDGQVRNLMIKYIQDNKTISPVVESTWQVSAKAVAVKGTLPKTGEPIDMNTLFGIGGLVVVLGAIMLLKSRKEKKDMAA